MVEIIQYNEDSERFRGSQEFREYLAEHRIEETSSGRYRVPGGISRYDAVAKLCDLAVDMLVAFDLMPSSVDPRGNPLEFANQFGVFYIDDSKKE